MNHERVVLNEQIGDRWLVLSIVRHRFVLQLKIPGEQSWSRVEFYTNYDQAKERFYQWRDQQVVALAARMLGVER
jgi:hypothetical protein